MPHETNTDHATLVDTPVTDVMSQPVFTVTEDVSLLEALTAMLSAGCRHLAVVDTAGRCLGVVSDRAVAADWADDPTRLPYRRVHQLLDPHRALVGTTATVGDAARRMATDTVDAVAVIDRSGYPVGMVTGGDLIALMARALPGPSNPL